MVASKWAVAALGTARADLSVCERTFVGYPLRYAMGSEAEVNKGSGLIFPRQSGKIRLSCAA